MVATDPAHAGQPRPVAIRMQMLALRITDHIWSIDELIDAALFASAPQPTPPAPGSSAAGRDDKRPAA